MDFDYILNGLGITGGGAVVALIVYRIVTSKCVKAKCVQGTDGQQHLDLSLNLNDSQRAIVQEHPDVLEAIKRIEALLVLASKTLAERVGGKTVVATGA